MTDADQTTEPADVEPTTNTPAETADVDTMPRITEDPLPWRGTRRPY